MVKPQESRRKAAQSREEPVRIGIEAVRKRREPGTSEQSINSREHQVKL